MKYIIQIENVSRYIMGALIKSFKDLCPKGIKAIWTEDVNKSTNKMKTGKIEINTKFSNKEKQLYDTKKDIETKLNQLLNKAEAEKQAWFEEQKAKKQAEYEAKKAQAKKEREEQKAKRNTFAELIDDLDIKNSPQKKGKWPPKFKVVDQPQPTPVPKVVQPKGAWAKGKPTVREVAQEPVQTVVQEKQPTKLPQITPTFGGNLHFGSWTELDDEDAEYAELDKRFSNSNPVKDGWDDEDSWDDRWDHLDSQEEVY